MKKLFLLFLFTATAFAGKYKVLQVEAADGNNFQPNVPHSLLQTLPDEFMGTSGHASIVANNLVGPASRAKDLIGELVVCDATQYLYHQIGVGGFETPGVYELPRDYRGWAVENHSYGFRDMYLDPANVAGIWGRMAKRVNNDNVVVVVAVPDHGYGWDAGQWLGYWNWSPDVIRVGSSTGNIDLNDKNPADPHLVADDEYPSYGAPKVSAAALCVIDVYVSAGKSYKAAEIRDILVSTCDWLPQFGQANAQGHRIYGAGMLNVDKAIAEARRRVAGNAPPVITPPVVTPPPPAVQPPPPPPPPVEKVTVKRTSWQNARALIQQSGWTLVPSKNGGADLVDPSGVRRLYITADSYRLLMFNTPALRKGNPLPLPPQ